MNIKKHLKNENYDIYEHYDYREVHTRGAKPTKNGINYEWIIGLPVIDLFFLSFMLSDASISSSEALFFLIQPFLIYLFYKFVVEAFSDPLFTKKKSEDNC